MIEAVRVLADLQKAASTASTHALTNRSRRSMYNHLMNILVGVR
jgi:hypothetical protein